MIRSRILFAGGLGLVGVAGIWLVKRLRQGSGYDDLDSKLFAKPSRSHPSFSQCSVQLRPLYRLFDPSGC